MKMYRLPVCVPLSLRIGWSGDQRRAVVGCASEVKLVGKRFSLQSRLSWMRCIVASMKKGYEEEYSDESWNGEISPVPSLVRGRLLFRKSLFKIMFIFSHSLPLYCCECGVERKDNGRTT